MEVQRKHQTPGGVLAGGLVLVTPPVGEGDYWSYRVDLSPTQAIIGFPKFGTVGIGFLVEEDWNTNLPWDAPAEEIYAWIARNKGDDAISDETCIEAIRLIQTAIKEEA